MLDCDGMFFQLVSSSAPISIDFRVPNSAQQDQYESIPIGFWFESKQKMTAIQVVSPVDQEISYIVSNGRTGIDRSAIVTVLAQGSAISNRAPATVDDEPGVILEGNTARQRAVFTSDPANTQLIVLGGPDVTFDNGTIILEPGDTWKETDSAPAAIFAVAGGPGQILRRSEG